MEEEFRAILAGSAGVSALVSGRIRPVRAGQQDALPFVVYQTVSGVPDYTSQGASGYVQTRVQVDCYGETYTSAKTVARSVVAALSGYRGGAIHGVFANGDRDLPAEDSGTVKNLFRVSLDFLVHHSS